MSKGNFKCPRCKKMVNVGKKLRAQYTCPNCHTSLLISREERNQGHCNFKKNFMFQK